MFNEKNTVGLDFETYGSRSLPTVGLENYVQDPYFQPLIARVVRRRHMRLTIERFNMVDHDGFHPEAVERLADQLEGNFIAAHNAPFEKRVLRTMGVWLPGKRFLDSAVISRAVGAGSKLEAAGPQLLGIDKMPDGWRLIKLFSMRGEYQERNMDPAFDPQIISDNLADWNTFGQYCEIDAQLSLDITLQYGWVLSFPEMHYSTITTAMNETGWHVDLDLVKEMQRRYERNLERALTGFRERQDAAELNLNSLKQMKEWCAERGVKATSFDEKHVASLLKRLGKKLEDPTLTPDKVSNYRQVHDLLVTKQILGGSSLKKLQTILNNVTADSRLHDQYLHAGAGQTLRTSGYSVQMQNLKRLKDPANMEELYEDATDWDNSELAENLRQVFTAEDPDGALIVGDFSSVESRGLAYQAGADWKLQAFRQGKDMYKVQAEKIYNEDYALVSKEQRQTGKVGELSCGYGAGPGAVQAFASNMGVEMTEGEATSLVNNWRETNPEIVTYWDQLDRMLHLAVETKTAQYHELPYDELILSIIPITPPDSLLAQHPGSVTLQVEITRLGKVVVRRFFQGCYVRGRNVCYYKPSELKHGDLWRQSRIDPKTKQRVFYSIYGGKLAGILTQSLCRELFFMVLAKVSAWVNVEDNLKLVGQFHDEIVLEWKPMQDGLTLEGAKVVLAGKMSDSDVFNRFPLAAEIKHDWRYTK